MASTARNKAPAETPTIDCRGLLCPLPVLEAAKALRSLRAPFSLRILADDPAAVRDFTAFAKKRKLRLRVRSLGAHQQFTLSA